MTKFLFLGAIVLGALSLILFMSGFSSQQPLAFILALMCTFPGAAFLLGGSTLSFFSRYSVVPREDAVAPVRANHRRVRTGVPEPLN